MLNNTQVEKEVIRIFSQECSEYLGYINQVYYFVDYEYLSERVGSSLKRILKKLVSRFDLLAANTAIDYNGYSIDTRSTIKNTRGAITVTIESTLVDISYGEVGINTSLEKVYIVSFLN